LAIISRSLGFIRRWNPQGWPKSLPQMYWLMALAFPMNHKRFSDGLHNVSNSMFNQSFRRINSPYTVKLKACWLLLNHVVLENPSTSMHSTISLASVNLLASAWTSKRHAPPCHSPESLFLAFLNLLL
jgi:hypothetical protein